MPNSTRILLKIFIPIIIGSICFYQIHSNDQEAEDTVPHADVIIQLLDFTDYPNNDCILPCFAGIHPSETTLAEIQELSIHLFEDEAILSNFEDPFEREDGLLDYTFGFFNPVASGSFNIHFTIFPVENTLSRFSAQLNHPSNWLESDYLSMSEILKIFGEPSEIYIAIHGAQPPYFQIALTYKTLGTIFLYHYRFESDELTQGDEPIPLCGSWERTRHIDILMQAVDEVTYTAMLNEYLWLDKDDNTEQRVYRAFRSLDRLTNWNIDDFTDFLSENSEWCFDALSYNTLWETGYSY